ncbi:MAG: DUF86 domain-containing protein [Terricaulis sp.]
MTLAVTRLLLEDMLSYARMAVRFRGDLDAGALDADEMRLMALIRALEVVGEAASKVPASERSALAQIPWRRIIDFRNFLIHGYGRVRTEALVETVRDHVPPLIAELERILNTQGQG